MEGVPQTRLLVRVHSFSGVQMLEFLGVIVTCQTSGVLSIPLEAGPPWGEGSSSKNVLSPGGFVAKARSLTPGHVEGQQLLAGGRVSEGCPAGGVNLQTHRQVSCD